MQRSRFTEGLILGRVNEHEPRLWSAGFASMAAANGRPAGGSGWIARHRCMSAPIAGMQCCGGGSASSPISAVSSAAGGWRTASAGPGGEARSNSSLLARRRPRSQSSSPESLSRRNRD
jgi:hypothetical protein